MNSKKKSDAISAADKWNRRYKIGTPVTRYAAINPLAYPTETKTRSLAFVAESGDAVILVESIAGYVLLESVVVKEGAK
jgi:hypothetical protein